MLHLANKIACRPFCKLQVDDAASVIREIPRLNDVIRRASVAGGILLLSSMPSLSS
jgi:hypothetical protein